MLCCIAIYVLQPLGFVYLGWAVLALGWNIAGYLLKLSRVRGFTRFCEGPKMVMIGDKGVSIATQIHKDTTLPQVRRAHDWFSIKDILSRLSIGFVGFCYAMLSNPLLFIKYTFLFNKVFSGCAKAVVSAALLPFWPVLLFLNALYFNNLSFLPMLNVNDEALESLQFFTNSLGPVASFLYDYCQEFCNYVGNFYILGPNPDAIQTMYWDTEKTTKVFWREQLRRQGARVPGEVGIWDGKQLILEDKVERYESLLIKVTDSCMGIGDLFLKNGKDYTTSLDIEQVLNKKYVDKPCLLIEFIRAHPDLKVHSLDILTAKDPEGNVHLLDVIVWSGSPSETSHGATDCYMIDPLTGRTCSYGKWYNPNFVTTSPDGLGVCYPNVGGAVVTALETHQSLPYSWLNVIGWDCMVTEDSSIVFFEGNLAAWRCPRRLFLSLRNFIYFAGYISWVSQN